MRVSVDVGGTFTDLVYYDSGRFLVLKVPTTPRRLSDGVLKAMEMAKCDDIEILIHATTLGINMFLCQEGLNPPKIALVTTKGFRDVVEIGRQKRTEIYNLFFKKPIVMREDRYEVEERIDASENVLTPLNLKCVRSQGRYLKKVTMLLWYHSYTATRIQFTRLGQKRS